MAKQKFHMYIGRSGSVIVKGETWGESVETVGKTPEEKFEAVRTVVLGRGLVFDGKIQKMTRKLVWL